MVEKNNSKRETFSIVFLMCLLYLYSITCYLYNLRDGLIVVDVFHYPSCNSHLLRSFRFSLVRDNIQLMPHFGSDQNGRWEWGVFGFWLLFRK